jgi:hypothetical protein
MTIHFPDVSAYNTGASLAGAPVVLARSSIGAARDAQFEQFKSHCAAAHIKFAGYHFLNAPSLGVSAAGQADLAYAVCGSTVPLMLDVETNRKASASVADAIAFVHRYRQRGGLVHLVYLPHWYWQQLGSPDLRPLCTALGVGLVSSNYRAYTDDGAGWDAYGGVTPVQWQYTDAGPGGLDWNAYRGSVEDYWALLTGSTLTEDDPMAQLTDNQLLNVLQAAMRINAAMTPLASYKVPTKLDESTSVTEANYLARILAAASEAPAPAQLVLTQADRDAIVAALAAKVPALDVDALAAKVADLLAARLQS